MRFRASFVQSHLPILSNVITAFLRAAKQSSISSGHTTELPVSSLTSQTRLDLKLCKDHILIRYCTPSTFDRTQIFAYFDASEIFNELLVESRYEDIIGLTVDANCLASTLKAGAKAHRTVVKLSRRGEFRYLSFLFFMMGDGERAIEVYQDCVISLLPPEETAEIISPPENLLGENVELRSLRSLRGVVDRMRRIGVESIAVSVQSTQAPVKQGFTGEEKQQLCEVQISGKTDFATVVATFNRCFLHSFEDSNKAPSLGTSPSLLDSSASAPEHTTTSHRVDDSLKLAEDAEDRCFPETHLFLLKNIYLLLQLSTWIQYDFVLLKLIKDQSLFMTFPLKRMSRGHVVCVTTPTVET